MQRVPTFQRCIMIGEEHDSSLQPIDPGLLIDNPHQAIQNGAAAVTKADQQLQETIAGEAELFSAPSCCVCDSTYVVRCDLVSMERLRVVCAYQQHSDLDMGIRTEHVLCQTLNGGDHHSFPVVVQAFCVGGSCLNAYANRTSHQDRLM